MVAKKSVRAWEEAYRRYGAASDHAARLREVDAATAQEMAWASFAVAAAWRHIAHDRDLAWWTVAALESAAQAFEDQAEDWEIRSAEATYGVRVNYPG
ncbi:hypothetical protein EV191_101625 [Tamaricihabitans halophyticus]|uniref:Uncharacterized protein n=1 Tax=Tamaricihabitans halophyticus TaxID=1262583 RepID=A0A4R2R4I3_9PSEU|nr:hypothetical protein [Tamaricihabitans halophyticus]TCP56679.1 hypothetical protein EV191_101625 [Tamaricihabitans halophyticus]